MKNKNKRVLILGGSSDIGIEVVKDFLNMNWDVTAHYFKNKKKLKKLKNKKLKLIHANFMKFNEKVGKSPNSRKSAPGPSKKAMNYCCFWHRIFMI